MPGAWMLAALLVGTGCSPGGDGPPRLALTEPRDGDLYLHYQPVLVAGNVADERPDEVQVTVHLEDAGASPLVEATPSFTGLFSVLVEPGPGLHTLVVRATDAAGQSDERTVQVEVRDNQAPVAPDLEIAPAAPVQGEALLATILNEPLDPDGDPVAITWTWELNGVLASDIDGPEVPEGRIQAGETWTVRAQADDGFEVGPSGSATVTVSDAPSVTVRIEPRAPRAGDAVACNWTAEDPSGLEVAVEARWTVNGQDAGDAAGTPTLPWVRDDLLGCTVTASSAAGVTTRTDEVTVANTPPEITEVRVEGTPATETSTLTCVASAADVDGDATTITTAWRVDGAIVGTGSPTLDGASFDKGDEVLCSAQAADDLATGAAVDSDPVTVVNSPPSAPGGAAIHPGDVPVGVALTCEVTGPATDPDPADTVGYTYAWSADGVTIPGATADTLDTDLAGAGARVACTVAATDGEDLSATVASGSVTVLGRLEGPLEGADADAVVASTVAAAEFGHLLDLPTDLDGDGGPDLLVGAWHEDDRAGAVYLFSGADVAAAMGGAVLEDLDALARIAGEAPLDRLGYETLAWAPRLDGDTRADLVLASPDAASGRGRVYLLASADGWADGAVDELARTIVEGSADGERLGEEVAAGDLDGDGLPEVAAGATGLVAGGAATGAIVVFHGDALPVGGGQLARTDADHVLYGEEGSDWLGYYGVRVVGDVDGDGHPELAVGALLVDGTGGADTGATWLLSGGDLAALASWGRLDGQAWARLEGADTDARFGEDAADAGDLDGDGRHELWIGARDAQTSVGVGGAAYLFEGGPWLRGTHDATEAALALGTAFSGAWLGRALATGDLDGDDLPDLCVGAPRAEDLAPGGGLVALVPGADLVYPAADTGVTYAARAWVRGETEELALGMDCAIGDLDGDGWGDLVAGAPGHDAGQGAVLVLGGP